MLGDGQGRAWSILPAILPHSYSPAGQEDSLPEFTTLKHEILFAGAEGLSYE